MTRHASSYPASSQPMSLSPHSGRRKNRAGQQKKERGKFIHFLLFSLFLAFASLRVVCAFGGFYEKLPCFLRTHSPPSWPREHAPNLWRLHLAPALAAIYYMCVYIYSFCVLLFAFLVPGNFGVWLFCVRHLRRRRRWEQEVVPGAGTAAMGVKALPVGGWQHTSSNDATYVVTKLFLYTFFPS